MTIIDFLSKNIEESTLYYGILSQYAACQCTGCSDTPQILAYKAQQSMSEAHKKGENPIHALNNFLGTSIPEEVFLSLISDKL